MSGSSYNLVAKRQAYSVAILLGVVYLVVWYVIGSPYRLVPSDDEYFILNIAHRDNVRILFSTLLRVAHAIFKPVLPATQIFYLVVVFGNAISCAFSYLIVERFTKNNWLALLAAATFSLATWSSSYHYWGSYTTLMGALTIGAVYFFSLSPSKYSLFAAGVCCAGMALTHLAGFPIVLSLFVTYLFQNRNVRFRKLIDSLIPVCIPLLIAAAIRIWTLEDVLYHLSANTENLQSSQTVGYLGYLPKGYFFSFFHILHFHHPIYVYAFFVVLLSVVFAGNLLERKVYEFLKFGLVFILLSGFIIDLLPTTKLARTHYPVFPVLLVILVVGIAEGVRSSPTKRWVVGGIFGVVLVWLFQSQIRVGRKMWVAKNAGAEKIEALARTHKLYVLKSDAFASQLSRWIRAEVTEIEKPSQMDGDQNTALVYGPYGKRSRNTIVLRYCVNLGKDNLELKQISDPTEHWQLPYHAYFPLFAMENEICQPRYLHGDFPDATQPKLRLQVFLKSRREPLKLISE